VKDTISYFRTSGEHGLLHSDIATLRESHGYNEFSVSTPEPVLLKFAKTIYESPLILLLCGSATVSAVMGNVDDAISITLAVLIVLTGELQPVFKFFVYDIVYPLVGFVQERRSEKSLEALNKLVPHHCHVVRYVIMYRYIFLMTLNLKRSERETIHVLANELVPGDIITFSTGDRIPADIRIISSVDLEIDESSLTGETEARRKNADACLYENIAGKPSADSVALADRTCIAYMGTLVRNGESNLLHTHFAITEWSA
jgi:P-type Ca2+ transporter type 2C